ncbi:MAG: hypothetical protein WCK82_15060 [Bacteroidota bacterium]
MEQEFSIQGEDRPSAFVGGICGSVKRSMCKFAKERVAGAYYAMSINGNNSYNYGIAEFLKQRFSNEWLLSEFKYEKNGRLITAKKKNNYYASILRQDYNDLLKSFQTNNPGRSVESIKPIKHSLTYQYLFKESEGQINIIGLGFAGYITVCINSVMQGRETNYSYKRLQQEIAKAEQSLGYLHSTWRELALDINNFIGQKTKAMVHIDKLKRKIADKQRFLDKLYRDNMRHMPLHMALHKSSSCFDLSLPSSYSIIFLREIRARFPHKPIKIHALLRSQASSSENIVERVIAATSNQEETYVGHFSYAALSIDPRHASMAVRVVNPTLDKNQPYIRAIAGEKEPLPTQSLSFFREISQAEGLDLLDHTYHYRGDQVLNFHDCGRFSIIYLIAEILGKSPLEMSNHDIYLGFKELQRHHYDESKTRPDGSKTPSLIPSRFSRFATGPVRAFCDYTLGGKI